MDNVFIVMAEERGYCTSEWIVAVFSKKGKADDLRGRAQARADAAHEKLRALGEEEGTGACWQHIFVTPEWTKAHEDCGHPVYLEELYKLKGECFPEDPDAEIGWGTTMHYTVQEWSVDSMATVGHKRRRF